MWSNISVDFAAIGTVVSFISVSASLERHSLSGQPQLSTVLLLLLSGSICFAASRAFQWIQGENVSPVAHGGNGSILDVGQNGPERANRDFNAPLPSRPGRLALPGLVFCIVARLEIQNQVARHKQCATTGFESFLCAILFLYEIYSSRRKYTLPLSESDDPWRTVFDDLYDWFSGPRVAMVIGGIGVFLISLGTFSSTSQMTRSTFVCFEPLDGRAWTLGLQLLGLYMGAAIIVQLWRILAWTQAVQPRLRTLSTVLLLSSLAMIPVWVVTAVFWKGTQFNFSLAHLLDLGILLDSIALSAFVACGTFWACRTSLLVSSSATTILVGFLSCWKSVRYFGDWAHINWVPVAGPSWVIACGAVLFMHFHSVRSVFFLRRTLFILLLLGFATAMTICVSRRTLPNYPRHPISDLIYKAHVEHDRWLKDATVSNNIRIATEVYQERRHGRVPPPYFDEWYQRAKGTVMMDSFQQIEDDLSPFWNYPPDVLRQKAEAMSHMPDVFTITITNGEVAHSHAEDDGKNNELKEMAEIIAKFSEHLPDMILPINLDPFPRILPARGAGLEDMVQKKSDAASSVLSQRSPFGYSNITKPGLDARVAGTSLDSPTLGGLSSNDYREMLLESCPPGSRSRTQPHWDISKFCHECIRRHSKHQYMTKWNRSMETCQQGDLRNMHDMYLTEPGTKPIPEFMPLLSPSKTDAFRDILVPLPRDIHPEQEPDIKWEFARRFDSLFWRGRAEKQDSDGQVLRGSQRYRLLHLLLSPNARDEVTVLLPAPKKKGIDFTYEKLPATEVNAVSQFDVGIEGLSQCSGWHCEMTRQVFGAKDDGQEPLEYRYVLLMDDSMGPPGQLIRTVRSDSVPFVATVFRSWYTERLQPYLHFVPVDLRFHALHSTYLYFAGTSGDTQLPGRAKTMKGRSDDGEWIAREGRKWAGKAMGRRDVEAYLFRLLLEWGRLVDDRRDVVGFRKTEQGGFENVGWTMQGKAP